MQIQPYLFFEGRCEEAINFYSSALGAKQVTLMRYKDYPGPRQPGMVPPCGEEKVMHARFQIGDTTVLASDGRCEGAPTFSGFALTVLAGTDAEAERVFKALSEGGEVQMPLTRTFFSSKFGMVADRFGVSWMVYVAAADNP